MTIWTTIIWLFGANFINLLFQFKMARRRGSGIQKDCALFNDFSLLFVYNQGLISIVTIKLQHKYITFSAAHHILKVLTSINTYHSMHFITSRS